jgi:hypothetical protein
MIHVFKSGGDRKSPCGKVYSIKAINLDDKAKFLSDGWVASLDDIKKPKAKAKAKKVIKDDNQE